MVLNAMVGAVDARCRRRSGRGRWSAVLTVLAALAAVPSLGAVPLASSPPGVGEVTLALGDYLELLQSVEARERARAERELHREPNVAEVTAQSTRVVVDADDATVEQIFEVAIQGSPAAPVALPLTGLASESRIERLGAAPAGAGAAAAVALDGGDSPNGVARLVASLPGRYRVTVRGRAPLPLGNGRRSLALATVLAPVAEATFDLPADADWNCAGAVPVEDQTTGARRRLRLALPRGSNPTFELRRKGDLAEAERLLASTVTLTLFQLLPEGPRRFDIVLYDVERGGLAAMEAALPVGLSVDKVITDEGETFQEIVDGRLHVERKSQLRGTGYLVIVSTPAASEGTATGARNTSPLAIGDVLPTIAARARYVVVSSAIAAQAIPEPEASWSRVDLDDLPPTLRTAVGGLDLLAAWRRGPGAAGVTATLRVDAAPSAARLETLIRTRETTTLLTLDGTLLTRDRLALAQRGDSLRVTLPAAAKLWSASVGNEQVVPLRQGGDLIVPLALAGECDTEVEIVSVEEHALPAGRSRLQLSAPLLHAPVLDHRWRVLLPEGARYRYAGGDLRPAVIAAPRSRRGSGYYDFDSYEEMKIATGNTVSATELAKIPAARDPWALLQKAPGVLADRINVGGNESEALSVAAGEALVLVRVLDDRGAPLPGAAVAASTPSGVASAAVSDAQGRVALRLAPGTYTLRGELQGFSTVDYPNLRTAEGRTTTVQLQLSAAVEDVITVTAESPLLDEKRSGATTTFSNSAGSAGGYRLGSARRDKERDERQAVAFFAQQAAELKQGLVGGVRPLPVVIPESGKALLLTGLLPPDAVSAAIEVKARR